MRELTVYTLSEKSESSFLEYFRLIQRQAYQIAVAKGWWDKPREAGTIIALMHSELSEALEAMRHHNPPSNVLGGASSVEEELADVIIRIMDFADHANLDIANAVLEKMRYNVTREHKHGGKDF